MSELHKPKLTMWRSFRFGVCSQLRHIIILLPSRRASGGRPSATSQAMKECDFHSRFHFARLCLNTASHKCKATDQSKSNESNYCYKECECSSSPPNNKEDAGFGAAEWEQNELTFGCTLTPIELLIPSQINASPAGVLVVLVTVTSSNNHPEHGLVSLQRMTPGDSSASVIVTLRDTRLVTGTRGSVAHVELKKG